MTSELTPEIELTEEEIVAEVNSDYAEKYGFADEEDYVYKPEKGINEELIRHISGSKNEPEWMLQMRLDAYQHFLERPMPDWGSDLSAIDEDEERIVHGALQFSHLRVREVMTPVERVAMYDENQKLNQVFFEECR